MSSRSRLSLTSALLALTLGLTACGSDTGSNDSGESGSSADGLSQVEVSGDFGKAIEVKFDGEVSVDETESEVVIEGDGAEVQDGESVIGRIWVGSGTKQEKVFSSYDPGAQAEVMAAGSETLIPALSDNLAGHPLGSRVVVAAAPEDAFGPQGSPQLGIEADDSVLFVIDMVELLPDGPDGKPAKPASWAPKLQEADGVPTGFDFAGTPKPTDQLRTTYLIRGDGPKVEKNQTVHVNYLGQVYQGKEPFDASYGRAPFPVNVGAGMVVKGWDESLPGVPVGSRIIISVPPDYGYGKEGQPGAGIKGDDTMFFVIDVLAAS